MYGVTYVVEICVFDNTILVCIRSLKEIRNGVFEYLFLQQRDCQTNMYRKTFVLQVQWQNALPCVQQF